MEAFQSLVSLVITLGILVTFHEYGHYWVARRCGVKVLRFSVGFGKPLYTWVNKEGTEFCVAAIPLGGYVRMLDEREAEVAEHEKSLAFNNKSPGQRIAIASAGPIANFLFAIFAYWLMFVIGFNVVKPVVGEVQEDSIAAIAGIPEGAEFVSVGDRTTPGWRDVSISLANYLGESALVPVRLRTEDQETIGAYNLTLNDWLLGADEKNLLKGIGISPWRPTIPAVMGQVIKNDPADQGGMLPGDRVIEADGVAISDWFSLVKVIEASPEKPISVIVMRGEDNANPERVSLILTPASIQGENGEVKGRLGVGVQPFSYPENMIKTVSYGPLESIGHAAGQTWADTSMTLNAIRKMLVGLLSLENLSGPITIAQVASQSISSGLEDFLAFLALLSVSLGVLNLLPIPVLDGGHILFYTLEAIRGKPIPESWQIAGMKIGISFVVALMVIAFYNDLMRL